MKRNNIQIKKMVLSLSVLLAIAVSPLIAQNYVFLDPTFNNGQTGYYPPPTDMRKTFYDLAVLDDGSIILAGTYEPEAWVFDFAAVKVLSNGMIDSTFGDNGLASIHVDLVSAQCRAVAALPDGKILLAGYNGISHTSRTTLIARLNGDGSIDTTFGNNGIVKIEYPLESHAQRVKDIYPLPDGKFYVAGAGLDLDYIFMLARFNADGTIDESFGEHGYGYLTGDFQVTDDEQVQIVVQNDGKILTIGRWKPHEHVVARFLSNGVPDSSYGSNGVVRLAMEYSSFSYIETASGALQSDGKLVVAGAQEFGSFFQHRMVAARVNTDGSIDSTFGDNGYALVLDTPLNASFKEAEARSILIDENDYIYLGGRKSKSTGWWNFAIVRLTPDGMTDTSFADNGYLYTGGAGINGASDEGESIEAMAWDGNKIVAGGGFYVARFLTDNITNINDESDSRVPFSFALHQNYPNPFNPSTVIKYQLKSPGFVTLKVYDILGKEISTLVNEYKNAGYYSLPFDANSIDGGLASGVYIYKLQVNDFVAVKKMLLTK
jgi:uncharacterized delta-60 repeat protein